MNSKNNPINLLSYLIFRINFLKNQELNLKKNKFRYLIRQFKSFVLLLKNLKKLININLKNGMKNLDYKSNFTNSNQKKNTEIVL